MIIDDDMDLEMLRRCLEHCLATGVVDKIDLVSAFRLHNEMADIVHADRI